MSPELLWKRYAAIWPLDEPARSRELAACVAEDVAYCDAEGLIGGRAALSIHMEKFKRDAPGASFHIDSVLHHHRRTLARWTLRGPDRRAMQTGASFALQTDDGRLQTITSFAHAAERDARL
jgi:hypothetical protein